MQDFASTGNGRRFLADVHNIAKALEKLALFVEWQQDQAREDIWARLYDDDHMMYQSLKSIQEGDVVHGAARGWNRRLEDYLRQLKIPYHKWLFHRATEEGNVYGTGNPSYSGCRPHCGFFEGTMRQQELCLEAVLPTVEVVTW